MKIVNPLGLFSNKTHRKESKLAKKLLLLFFILVRQNLALKFECGSSMTAIGKELSDTNNKESKNSIEEQTSWIGASFILEESFFLDKSSNVDFTLKDLKNAENQTEMNQEIAFYNNYIDTIKGFQPPVLIVFPFLKINICKMETRDLNDSSNIENGNARHTYKLIELVPTFKKHMLTYQKYHNEYSKLYYYHKMFELLNGLHKAKITGCIRDLNNIGAIERKKHYDYTEIDLKIINIQDCKIHSNPAVNNSQHMDESFEQEMLTDIYFMGAIAVIVEANKMEEENKIDKTPPQKKLFSKSIFNKLGVKKQNNNPKKIDFFSQPPGVQTFENKRRDSEHIEILEAKYELLEKATECDLTKRPSAKDLSIKFLILHKLHGFISYSDNKGLVNFVHFSDFINDFIYQKNETIIAEIETALNKHDYLHKLFKTKFPKKHQI